MIDLGGIKEYFDTLISNMLPDNIRLSSSHSFIHTDLKDNRGECEVLVWRGSNRLHIGYSVSINLEGSQTDHEQFSTLIHEFCHVFQMIAYVSDNYNTLLRKKRRINISRYMRTEDYLNDRHELQAYACETAWNICLRENPFGLINSEDILEIYPHENIKHYLDSDLKNRFLKEVYHFVQLHRTK